MGSASPHIEKMAALQRPALIAPLLRPCITLAGVGPKMAKALARLLGGERVIDLVSHAPIDWIDRTYRPPLAQAQDGRIATLSGQVIGIKSGKRAGQPTRIILGDDSGMIDLVFFKVYPDWLAKHYPEGEWVIVSGTVERYGGMRQIAHPDWLGRAEGFDWAQLMTEPIYPLTEGVHHKSLLAIMRRALDLCPVLPEWIGRDLITREGWPDWRSALDRLHAPKGTDDLAPHAPHKRRLAYDELLAHQLALARLRATVKGERGRAFPPSESTRARFLSQLPFQLTGAQQRALQGIDQDMARPARMMRLLQGDVGSGKTIVAALAMLNAMANGAQSVLMAPTEILARQHWTGLEPLFSALGYRVELLTGRSKGKTRDALIAAIASGAVHAVIGTHALFQDDVVFHDLGLAVIDEQHRFGVHQRLTLTRKGDGIDTLVMTATPIPRTLTMTVYGDLDVSRLDEKPPGRVPIDTRMIASDKLDDLIKALVRKASAGAQIYWVCPLVDESEKLDLAAAHERAELLRSITSLRVGLVHGRMKGPDKDRVMADFQNHALDILVATTVIEVGVNIPNATVMVIDHAERFGLAQLHQLRGRVGRGSAQSHCFLLYAPPLGTMARERLDTLRRTEDGFALAELDLKLRGPGDILGSKQSGVPDFRFVDLTAHQDLIAMARDDARLLIAKDPDLRTERGEAARLLLHLFGYGDDQGMRPAG